MLKQPPKILVIPIIMFSLSSSGSKNGISFIIDRVIDCHGFRYKLLSYIGHHGTSTKYGYYNSTLFFSDFICLCNDNLIKKLVFKKNSYSVYMLFVIQLYDLPGR